YVPAAVNLAAIAAASGDQRLQQATAAELTRRAGTAASWRELDGPMLPLGYAATAIDRSLALQAAVRQGEAALFARELACHPG
ncbi:MAG: hypothetical protein K8J09_20105, partial [Planctomycetes bacterium]|nr:hypothetical protein [Planctomycetota bacterium]